MDPVRNPYTPGAGTRPSELAGREEEIENFRILLARLRDGRHEESQIIIGLRGVGKTVLLNSFEDHAESAGYLTAFRELTQESSLSELLARDVPRLLRELKLSRKLADTVRDDDFTELFLQLGRAAKEKKVGIALFLDELQFVREAEFRALISALHRTMQKQLPLTLAAAGLPWIPGLAGEARSYAERLFRFPYIGALDEAAARAALVVPAEREGATFEPDAVTRILELTQAYPFYLQAFGKHIWNLAAASPITRADVDNAAPRAEQALDRGLYEVRIQRATLKERRYLRAMAELGAGPYKAGAVARAMGTTTTTLSTIRQKLLDRGLIYATEDYGFVAFTVPRFDEFMRRHMPYEAPSARSGHTRSRDAS